MRVGLIILTPCTRCLKGGVLTRCDEDLVDFSFFRSPGRAVLSAMTAKDFSVAESVFLIGWARRVKHFLATSENYIKTCTAERFLYNYKSCFLVSYFGHLDEESVFDGIKLTFIIAVLCCHIVDISSTASVSVFSEPVVRHFQVGYVQISMTWINLLIRPLLEFNLQTNA